MRSFLLSLLLTLPAASSVSAGQVGPQAPGALQVSLEILDFDCSNAPGLFAEYMFASADPAGFTEYLDRLKQTVPYESALLHSQTLMTGAPTRQVTTAGDIEFSVGLDARPAHGASDRFAVAVEYSLTEAGGAVAGTTTSLLGIGEAPVSLGGSSSEATDSNDPGKTVRRLRIILMWAEPAQSLDIGTGQAQLMSSTRSAGVSHRSVQR